MEPPAETSCSQQLSSINSSNNANRNFCEYAMYCEPLHGFIFGRESKTYDGTRCISSTPTTYQLQIDPNITFNSVNRPFEELPENFLESISPQQNQGSVPQESPQLAPLAPMSLSSNDNFGKSSDFNAYATLAPMSATPSYVGAMKIEPLQDQLHSTSMQHSSHSSGLDKLSSGPAGLLSPLQTTTRSDNLVCSNLLGTHQNGGRANEMLAGLRRHHPYIKEEVDLGQDFKTMDSPFISHQSQQSANLLGQDDHQQELDHRLANAETPPAVSNVELASSFIATMIGEQIEHGSSIAFNFYEICSYLVTALLSSAIHSFTDANELFCEQFQPSSPTPQHTIFRQSGRNFSSVDTELRSSEDLEVNAAETSGDDLTFTDDNGEPTSTTRLASTVGASRVTYSTKDSADPLNAEIDDDIYIDTTDLCKRIAWELKQHSIPQAIFAERILCRSQGTLSDLLRNPKPWNKLKSGRETFRRMFNWVQQPLELRLGILDMGMLPSSMSPPTPAQNARQGSRHKGRDSDGSTKRPRLAIFKETQRPSREMQQTIAEHLQLDLSTVANFFMNARRRSRSGPLMGDAPAPYQQVRPITPPPESPPQHRNPNKVRGNRHISRNDAENSSITSSSRIETTVAQVVEEAAEYARRYDESTYSDEKNLKFRIGEIDSGVGIEDSNSRIDYEDQPPEYKMIRLSNDHSLSIDSRQIATADELLASELPDDEAQLNSDPNTSMQTVKTVSDKDESVFLVSVPATSESECDNVEQQQRLHPVMSFGNKMIIVKVEQRENPNSNTAANSH
ncbi:Homeobox protein onecut [Dirofilaria immitis]|nr:Homeobox protein onecut [Dirofilaria immitis]